MVRDAERGFGEMNAALTERAEKMAWERAARRAASGPALGVTRATASPDRWSLRPSLDHPTAGVSTRHRPPWPGYWDSSGKDVREMSACNETKSGEVYVCAACRFEIQVLKSCAESAKGACSCSEPLSCCGAPLALMK